MVGVLDTIMTIIRDMYKSVQHWFQPTDPQVQLSTSLLITALLCIIIKS